MGAGPAAKKPADRRRTNIPERGEWKPAPGIGWQHGTKRRPFPDPPAGLMPASRLAWRTWMRAWFAAHWTPDDLPGLRVIVSLYDQVERGDYHRAAELRIQMDTYGITPKGHQDRRWAPPAVDTASPAKAKKPGRYDHLRAV